MIFVFSNQLDLALLHTLELNCGVPYIVAYLVKYIIIEAL